MQSVHVSVQLYSTSIFTNIYLNYLHYYKRYRRHCLRILQSSSSRNWKRAKEVAIWGNVKYVDAWADIPWIWTDWWGRVGEWRRLFKSFTPKLQIKKEEDKKASQGSYYSTCIPLKTIAKPARKCIMWYLLDILYPKCISYSDCNCDVPDY